MTATALIAPRAGIEYLVHQEKGVRWMLEREAEDAAVCRGGILADDMGLGKTFQTIGLLKNSQLEGMRTLIVCPPALIAGWTEELRACGYAVATLMQSSVWSPTVDGEPTVWLTTYPKACMYFPTLARQEFGRVVLDEGHVIRNGKATSRWAAMMVLTREAKCRWILSATPVQNGYSDWKNLCAWLRTKGPEGEIGETIMLRRTMDELREAIAALPPPPRFVAHDLSIPATGATAPECKLFRALCDQLNSIVDRRSVSALIKLELYLRIQQFLVHPQIYIESMRAKFKGAYPRPDWTGTATKWTAVMREVVLGVAAKKSTIVFCNFRQEMDRVVAAMERMRVPVFAVRGGMGTDKVGAAVSEAREAAARGPVVVVVQIVSGGAGLNLQFCSRILFLSQHWNPAVVHQAVGRAVRIGQKEIVEVHMFRVVDDVIDNLDRRMVDIHLAKIEKAKEICESLYEGFAPLDAIPSIYTAADHLADAEEEDSDSDSEPEDVTDKGESDMLTPVDAGSVTGDDPQ